MGEGADVIEGGGTIERNNAKCSRLGCSHKGGTTAASESGRGDGVAPCDTVDRLRYRRSGNGKQAAKFMK